MITRVTSKSAQLLSPSTLPKPTELLPTGRPIALLLIDVINDFAFPEASRLLRYALPAVRKIAMLKSRLVAEGVPVI